MEAGTPYWPGIRGVLEGEKSGLSHSLKAHLLRVYHCRVLLFPGDSASEKGKVPALAEFTVNRDQLRKVQMRWCAWKKKQPGVVLQLIWAGQGKPLRAGDI